MGMYGEMHAEATSKIQDNTTVERQKSIMEMLKEIRGCLIKTIMQENAATKALTGEEFTIPDTHEPSDTYELVLVLRELSITASCIAARLESALHRT